MTAQPERPPAAVPVLGAFAVLSAMLTLCGGGLRFVSPEGAFGDALTPVFDAPAARNLFYGSMALWMLVSLLLAVAGGGMLVGQRWARHLGLVYAWFALVAFIGMTIVNLAVALPALEESNLTPFETLRSMTAGPLTGCCPTVVAIVLLAVLYHDRVTAWAKGSG